MILVVALLVYFFVAVMERNPAFGIVFLWPLLAIKAEQAEFPEIVTTCNILISANSILMGGLMAKYWHEGANTKQIDHPHIKTNF